MCIIGSRIASSFLEDLVEQFVSTCCFHQEIVIKKPRFGYLRKRFQSTKSIQLCQMIHNLGTWCSIYNIDIFYNGYIYQEIFIYF